ncbi:uncharacterized protein LOC118438104 [Folsomia candida]|uniref:uncharacterized protein LOC118438104 n=1 Tax=Folsomia candida TaxID=158441 RepID=UPI001604FA26|nr:uncharacterized protein LOC118438104 [Folsomia candida]
MNYNADIEADDELSSTSSDEEHSLRDEIPANAVASKPFLVIAQGSRQEMQNLADDLQRIVVNMMVQIANLPWNHDRPLEQLNHIPFQEDVPPDDESEGYVSASNSEDYYEGCSTCFSESESESGD